MSTSGNKIRQIEKKIMETEKKIVESTKHSASYPGTVVSLRARPITQADLCFPVGGVVDQVNVRVGATVSAFKRDFTEEGIRGFGTSGDPSLLEWNADQIADAVLLSGGLLMTLRASNEDAYAALSLAINARSNAYFAKYADQPTLVKAIQDTYLATGLPTPTLQSKSQHLQNLMQISQQQWTALSDLYKATNFTAIGGVALPLSTPAVVDHSHSDITTDEPEVDSLTTGSGGTNLYEQGQSYPYTVNQHIDNQDFVFSTPYNEAQAQFERAQLSLADELFGETMRQQTVANYQEVLTNELNSLNLGVYRLQIAYLNTFLTAPFSGQVTGVYKQPGEAVRAGETVIRLEDNSQVYLIGIVVYAGLIQSQTLDQPGTTATIQTSLYDAGGTPTTLNAEVLTARGCGNDDTWELVLLYVNDGSSGPVLPLDYHFDFDNTSISFT